MGRLIRFVSLPDFDVVVEDVNSNPSEEEIEKFNGVEPKAHVEEESTGHFDLGVVGG